MTPADRIILAAGQRIRDRVLSISDDMEFDAYRREVFENHSLPLAVLGGVSGIATEHMHGKHYAGIVTTFEKRGLDQVPTYVEKAKPYHGKALSRAEHGNSDAPDDLDAWWLENCPPEYKTQILSEYISTHETNPVVWAFQYFLQRFPQQDGHEYYTNMLDRGTPVHEIVKQIENSPEAKRLKKSNG